MQSLKFATAVLSLLALSACNEGSSLLDRYAPLTPQIPGDSGRTAGPGVRPDVPAPGDDSDEPSLPAPAPSEPAVADEPEASEEPQPIIELQAQGFRGDAETYGRTQVSDQENDGEEHVATFRVLRYRKHLSTAQNVARFLWAAWWPRKTTEAPFPCGVRYEGEIEGKASSRDGLAIYVFEGSGRGWKDSCTGTRGNEEWHTRLEVRMDGQTRQGTVLYYSTAEY
jgi:hypothetical protein